MSEPDILYHVLKLKDTHSNGLQSLLKTVADRIINRLEENHLQQFGIFYGAFGLATNEIYWVTFSDSSDKKSDGSHADPKKLLLDSNLEILTHHHLIPTVRPTRHQACTNEGIYVFRWFKVHNKDVDEIARLSEEAWQTFESDFESEIKGLFADVSRETKTGNMLLITWYKDLSVWQNSRQPSAEARQRFLERHELTIEATPIATRLYLGQPPSLGAYITTSKE